MQSEATMVTMASSDCHGDARPPGMQLGVDQTLEGGPHVLSMAPQIVRFSLGKLVLELGYARSAALTKSARTCHYHSGRLNKRNRICVRRILHMRPCVRLSLRLLTEMALF